MKTNVTRQVSAAVYKSSQFRDQLFDILKNKYQSIVITPGIDEIEIMKHVLNSRRIEKNYALYLFFPAIIFWFLCLLILLTRGENLSIGFFSFFMLLYFVMYIMVLKHESNEYNFLKNNLYKESYNSDFSCENIDTSKIELYKDRIAENVVFYSGYSPFVGSGFDIGGWSFVIDIDKGKEKGLLESERMEPLAFNEAELYSTIKTGIVELGFLDTTIQDKVYINGKRIRGNRELLPNMVGHPVKIVSDEYMKAAINNNVKEARHYQSIQVVDWDGDIVLSCFLRFKRNDKSLFVESNYYLLPPIQENLKSVDNLKNDSEIGEMINWLITGLFKTFLNSIWAIFLIFTDILRSINKFFRKSWRAIFGLEDYDEKIVRTTPNFDYGAKTSIRQDIMDGNYSQHFQKLDKDLYLKTIEKRILNLLYEFLDNRNIDTTEFKERQTTVLNEGVIVTGGNLTGKNIAVGEGSKINTKSLNNFS